MSFFRNRLAALRGPRTVHGLRLRRSLAVVDLETTGTTPASDRIIEVSIIRLSLDGSEETLSRRVNPQIPIPPEATAIHGITDAGVASEPPFSELAPQIDKFLKGCDLAGYNIIRFDVPMLEAKFARAGVDFSRKGRALVDAMTIFHMKEPRDLAAAARLYLDRAMPETHSSETDARTTLDVLTAQVARYPDIPDDIDKLHELCNPVDPAWIDPDGKFAWVNGMATITFGRHKGRSLEELAGAEPDYLQWMLDRDFSPEVQQILRDALTGKFPAPPTADTE